MKYKGAIIDMDDVLFPTSDYTEKVLNYSVAAMIREGLPAEHDEAAETLRRIRRKEGSNASNHFNLLCHAYGLKPAPERIVQAGVGAYHTLRERLWVPQDETDVFLKFLDDLDFRMGIITKGLDSKQWFKIIRLGIQDYFVERDGNGEVVKEFVYIMPDEHPEPIKGKQELTAEALRDMQADPARTFILDDRPYGIIAAKKAGVRFGIRLRSGKYSGQECPRDVDPNLKPDFEVGNLKEAMAVISGLERKIAAQSNTLAS